MFFTQGSTSVPELGTLVGEHDFLESLNSLVASAAAFTLRCDEIDDTKQMGVLLGRHGINTFF